MIKREYIYLELAILGAILPWLGFAKFFASGGGVGAFVGALFVNGAAGGFAVDLLISSVVFWVFLGGVSSSGGIDRPWIYVIVNLFAGLSCALPLALWRMERSKRLAGVQPVPAGRSVAAMVLLGAVVIGPAVSTFAEIAEREPAVVVDRFFEAYRTGDVDTMLEIYASDAVFVDVAQRHRHEGRAEIEPFLRQIVNLHEELGLEVSRKVVSENRVVVEYAYTGTLSGEALHQMTGNASCRDTDYSIQVTSWFEIRDGQIISQTDFIDLATLLEVKLRASGEMML